MPEPSYACLDSRGALILEGPDTRAFLQGVVSNDVEKVSPNRAIWAAFLTPQGKYLHDFFVVQFGDVLVLDCERARADDLVRRLSLYRLRSKVSVSDASERFAIGAVFGEGAARALGLEEEAGLAAPFSSGIAFVDPRLPEAGARILRPMEDFDRALEGIGFASAPFEAYDRLRLGLGLPDGSRDLAVEKTILLEAGFDELNGVDWNKGCFLGQELTARTKYRGLVKRRLVPVEIDGPAPAPASPIRLGEKEVGELRSVRDGWGLALVRLDGLEAAAKEGMELVAGDARVTPRKPAWASF